MVEILMFILGMCLGHIWFKTHLQKTLWKNKYFHLELKIAWYDLWFGIYKKPDSNTCYIMIPTIGIIITWFKIEPKYVVFGLDELGEVVIIEYPSFMKSVTFTNLAVCTSYHRRWRPAMREARKLVHRSQYTLCNLTTNKTP